MAGLRAPDGVLAAFFDDERDQRALPLQILPCRRRAADGDDLPRRVPERIEEKGPLLTDNGANLIARKLAVPDQVEEPMVQPRMRLLGLLQKRSREFGRRKHRRTSLVGRRWGGGAAQKSGLSAFGNPIQRSL